MSSKLNPKGSKKDRPRSTDRLRKGKRDGTPDKSGTPSQEAPDERPPSRNFIWNEEIEKLKITDDELLKLRESKEPSEFQKTPVPTTVVVRKLKPATEWDKPKPKIVTVAKPAPPNAPIKPLDYSGFAGPRYNHDGSVIAHSILGSYEHFHKEAIKRGDLLDLPSPRLADIQNEVPTVKYEKSTAEKISQKQANENNALMNWQLKMRERKLQQGYISKLLQKNPEDLAMNQADNYRSVQEKRYMIDRTIPFLDNGKGARVGSEFWKQQEQFGDDIHGIHLTLKQTEKGYPPPVEHIGIPKSVRLEKGWTWTPNYSAPVHYPWHKAPYYEQRKKQLQKVIDELDTHQPDFDGLEVIGEQFSNLNDSDFGSEALGSECEEVKNLQESNENQQEPFHDHPDVHPAPIFGPSVKFAGQPARWVGDSSTFIGQIGIEARVTFESYTGDRVMSYLEIINDGTTSVYYDWKKIHKENPFDLVKAHIQRFYFNNSNGVILPGETMKFPFVFKSPNAGVFTEQWKFQTRPVLVGGADLIVTLRGVALQEDVYQQQRLELERALASKQSNQIVREILLEVFNSIQMPPRPHSPIDAYITEEEIFTRNNYGIHYHHETIQDLKELHLQLYPEEERAGKFWDLCIQDLKDIVLELDDDDERKETFLQRINEAICRMSFSPREPLRDELYGVGYQLLVEAMDGIVGQAMLIRQSLGLPEKESDDFPDSELNPGTGKGDVAPPLKSPRKPVVSVGEAESDGKRGKAPEKSKSFESKDKKGVPGKDPKAAKGGKEIPKADSKIKLGSALKKSPTRGATSTPAPAGTPTGEMSTPNSPLQSPVLDADPLVEKKYQEKVYSRAYTILSDTVNKMDSAFQCIINRNNEAPLT